MLSIVFSRTRFIYFYRFRSRIEIYQISRFLSHVENLNILWFTWYAVCIETLNIPA